MRSPTYRGPGNTDSGLAGWRHRDIATAVRDALVDAWYYTVEHGRSRRALRALVAKNAGPLQLSIGSGRFVPDGWIGLDRRRGEHVLQCDLRRPLPLPDHSVDAVLTEHFLEHFLLDDVQKMLLDYHRALRAGAPIRVVCPDAGLIADLINDTDNERIRQQQRLDERVYGWSAELPWRFRSANRLSHQFGEHKSLLTGELMVVMLKAAGFTDILELAAEETAYFREVPTTHFRRFPDSTLESFVVEARAGYAGQSARDVADAVASTP